MIDDENINYLTLPNSEYSSKRPFGSFSTFHVQVLCNDNFCLCSVTCIKYLIQTSKLGSRDIKLGPASSGNGITS